MKLQDLYDKNVANNARHRNQTSSYASIEKTIFPSIRNSESKLAVQYRNLNLYSVVEPRKKLFGK